MPFAHVFAPLCFALQVSGSAADTGSAPDLLTPVERAWVAAHPRVVLGIGEDWAPSVMKDPSGKLSGFAVDQLSLINRKLSTDLRLEAGPWHDMVRKAETGEIDGLVLTAPLEERKSRFVFTDPYFTVHTFIFLRTEDAQASRAPQRLDDLRGKRVGYLKGTLREGRVLAQHPGITAVPIESYAALANRLLLGEIDAAMASYSLEYWRASNGSMGLVPTRAVPEAEARMVMSIRKDRAELAGILNKGLAAIARDDVEPLYRRWFGADYVSRTATFGAELSAEERAWLAAHPVLRVGIDPARAPIEFVERDGAAHGMSLAYLPRLGDLLGTRFEVVETTSWHDDVERLKDRRIDIMPAISATAERRDRIRFTEPYLTFPAAIFSAADVAYLGGPAALKGKRVAVIDSDAASSWLQEQWPEIELTPVQDTREGLRQVADGRAFAFIGNLVTTSYYIGNSGLTQIKVAGETAFVYRLGMGVRSDWPILAGILQKGIDAIPAPERDAIYRDWISIRYQHSVDYALLWKVVAAAALILLAVLVERALAMKRANARLRQLAKENSLVEERERRRLATDLHDSPMQKLALAQLQFGGARRGISAESQERMSVGLDLIREAIDELRSLQFELSPPMLHQEGLGPTLRWLAGHAAARSGVEFSFHEAGAASHAVPQDLAIVLFQCARELVYNAVKHSGARTGSIEIRESEGRLVLTVADDGKGMPSGTEKRESSRNGGSGLVGIRERLALFGGTLHIESSASGTRAQVRLALPRAAGATGASAAGIGHLDTSRRTPAPS